MILVTNLIKSSTDPKDDIINKAENKNWKWLHDYWQGKKYEIYRIEIPFETYQGESFCKIASECYKERSFVLFAIEISINGRPGDILLNPGPLILPRPTSKNIQYQYFGYIIAPDLDDASDMFKMSEKGTDNRNRSNRALAIRDNVRTLYQLTVLSSTTLILTLLLTLGRDSEETSTEMTMMMI